jgi:hypothetical protein
MAKKAATMTESQITGTPSLSEYMEKEKERLLKEIAELDEEITALAEEQAAFRRELRAIEAYTQVASGKAPEAPTGASRGTRSGTKREGLLKLLEGSAEGLTRAEFLEAMGAKGDTAAERSISNALSVMKKDGVISHDETTGKYTSR